MAYDYTTDPRFQQASPEEQHKFLMSADPAYAKSPPDKQRAYLASFKSNPQMSMGQNMWNNIKEPMRYVARAGGKLDTMAGLKTPAEAEQNVEPYADFGTKVLLTGLGGIAGRAAVPGHPSLAPAVGRVLTQGSIDALNSPDIPTAAREFSKGTQSGVAGEATGAALAKAMHPLAFLKKLIPQAGPEVGGKWVKDYTYGVPGGFPVGSKPVLVQDVLKNVPPPLKPPAALPQAGQAGYDQGLDMLRAMLGL